MSSTHIYSQNNEEINPEEERCYYVYMYRDPDTYEPFYIGKGKNGRMWDHMRDAKYNKRNSPNIFKIQKLLREGKYPYVHTFGEGLTNQMALDIEMFLIEFYGRESKGEGPLKNLTCGGEGIVGIDMPLRDRNVYKFTHSDGTVVYKTQNQMIKDHGFCSSSICSIVKGKLIHSRGWMLGDYDKEKECSVGKSFNFINVYTGEKRYCTQNELINEFHLNASCVTNIINQRITNTEGWYFESIPEKDYQRKAVKKTFKHFQTGKELYKTPEEMMYYLNDRKVYEVSEGNRNHVQGWFLDKCGKVTRVNGYDPRTYTFVNDYTGKEFTGTREELKNTFQITTKQAYKIITMKQKHKKTGWRIKKE